MSYVPPAVLLQRYADVLINFALGGGQGIAEGDVVRIVAHESAKPLYAELRRAVWRSGGHVIGHYLPDDDEHFNFSRDFFELASDEQIEFFPSRYMRGLVDEIDHQVCILSDSDLHALESVDPRRIMRNGQSMKPRMDWRTEKENAGRFSWTLGLYGTPAMAAEAGMTRRSTGSRSSTPASWTRRSRSPAGARSTTESPITCSGSTPCDDRSPARRGRGRRPAHHAGRAPSWVGGSGRNIPSFEIFTSPDWRGTEGWIRFNQPLYRYGNLVRGIRLEFADGRVVKAEAEENEGVLKEMVATENADKVGEFSLTDRRFSRITRFMAQTLYDENVGGPYGNTHIASASPTTTATTAIAAAVSREEWERLGFNESSVHTDIVSTDRPDRHRDAARRRERQIYAGGRFLLDEDAE